MSLNKLDHAAVNIVLIVDDVPDNLAVLHDALDDAGFAVLVANHGEAALERARQALPNIILLDAMMPGMDGFEVCRQLKADLDVRHIPVIFMTGLTEAEHVVAAFTAGGIDYVTKPIRPTEVLARIAAHLQTARQMSEAHGALDAFGQTAMTVSPVDGRVLWQTPLAQQWLQSYFASVPQGGTAENLADALKPPVGLSLVPAPVMEWLQASVAMIKLGRAAQPLIVAQAEKKLTFSCADTSNPAQWLILLNEESDMAQIQALMYAFKLTLRESEVLYWATKGKTNRDIGDILGTSPRTVNKHLEHVFIKLGVETRTAAASLALTKLRASKSSASRP